MIRLGLRLTLHGKGTAVRLAATAVGVALGAGLLSTTLAALNAVDAQNARYVWLTTGASRPAATGSDRAAVVDPLWWLLRGDRFDGKTIGRVDVAATGPRSPVPPGIPRLPGPGEFFASPALSRLLAATPASQLGDRYPGREVGTIGQVALPAPDSLIVVVGHRPDELAGFRGAQRVTEIRDARSECSSCESLNINSRGIEVILVVVAGALLFPMLVFIATAARLAGARREQRFAAMRLVGATPGQIAVVSAVESALVAALGVVAGFGLFFALRRPIAALPFTGAPFYPEDLSLGWAAVLLVALGVPLAAAVASHVALRRVQITPLGVSRQITPSAPRAYRVVPLLAGVGALAAVVVVGRPDTTSAQIRAYIPGFVLILVGLLVAGPWITLVASRVLARRTSRPATLIAARRIAHSPQAAFRSISGLVLALFVTSTAVGIITTFVAERDDTGGSTAARETLVAQPREMDAELATDPAALRALRDVPGVRGVTTIRANPLGTTVEVDERSFVGGLVSCAELDRTPALGRCQPGATTAAVIPRPVGLWRPGVPATVWRGAEVPAERLERLPARVIVVTTDGSAAAMEQARTTLELAYPELDAPVTLNEPSLASAAGLRQWQQLAAVVILTSLPIAGCSLAVSVAAGLLDRKRPFSLLRLTGTPLGVLRRVVVLESAVPLLLVALASIGTGLLAADLFLRAQLGYSLRPPETGYYLAVLVGIGASLAAIAATFPVLARITGPDTARNE